MLKRVGCNQVYHRNLQALVVGLANNRVQSDYVIARIYSRAGRSHQAQVGTPCPSTQLLEHR